MGVQEMTRYGMQAADFAPLATLIAEIVGDGAARPAGHWQRRVVDFRAAFREMRYCFTA
jgi:glycine/serine hydroxymethyltransferase